MAINTGDWFEDSIDMIRRVAILMCQHPLAMVYVSKC